MIPIKTDREIEKMRTAGRIHAEILEMAGDMIKPGITTADIEIAVRKELKRHRVKSPFKGYRGYPAATCISVNEEIVHGIPSRKKVIEEGAIVSIDLGIIYKGMITDAARTFAAGQTDSESLTLIEKTREAFFNGASMAVEGNFLYDISFAIQKTIEGTGFSLVRDFVSHGTGRQLHEEPSFLNFGTPGTGPQLKAGMTLAIEPMVNRGDYRVMILSDGWTAVTQDGRRSAHYENTVLIRKNDYEILTEKGDIR
ncbi:MAG: type I methionyl aminopeptidase [bacterium]